MKNVNQWKKMGGKLLCALAALFWLTGCDPLPPAKIFTGSRHPLVMIGDPPPSLSPLANQAGASNVVATGTDYSFQIYYSGTGTLTLPLRAYFVEVAPASSDFNLIRSGTSGPDGPASDYFVSGAGRFAGSGNVTVVSGTPKEVIFRLDNSAFTDAAKGDSLLMFVGQGTVGTGTNAQIYEGAIVYTVDSPVSLSIKKLEKKP